MGRGCCCIFRDGDILVLPHQLLGGTEEDTWDVWRKQKGDAKLPGTISGIRLSVFLKFNDNEIIEPIRFY